MARVALPIAIAIAMAPSAQAGPPDPNDHETACFTMRIRGTSVRRHVCTMRSQCFRKQREAERHPQLVLAEGCKQVSPVWCYELAPRDEASGTYTVCQPSRASCVTDRIITIRDLAPLPRRAKVRDTECTRRTSVSWIPVRQDMR